MQPQRKAPGWLLTNPDRPYIRHDEERLCSTLRAFIAQRQQERRQQPEPRAPRT